MIEEIKALIAIILMAFAITLPIALIDGEWKIWAEVWIVGVVAIVLFACGLWLIGVR